jgi:ribosomal protein RSM22 (predicted rRNA methylase)
MELPADLRDVLDAALAGMSARELSGSVDALIERYRIDEPAAEPILARSVDVVAYAAYRMPATFAAVRAALTHVALAVPTFAPKTQLDLGGGTGAAAWAASDVFPGLVALEVVDRAPAALALGRRLGLGSARPTLRSATWRQQTWPAELAPSDLVTVSYVLGELTDADQAELVSGAASVGAAVVVVEPGTPAGYRRVLAARDRLLAAGLRVVAPCPHEAPCPIRGRRDWCHFAVRINRSALHRRIKGGELGYEDEKFSYVAAVRDGPPSPTPGRILRHPLHRKGMVLLRVCAANGTAIAETISKRQGDRYRAARDLAWGDAWPASAEPDAARTAAADGEAPRCSTEVAPPA